MRTRLVLVALLWTVACASAHKPTAPPSSTSPAATAPSAVAAPAAPAAAQSPAPAVAAPLVAVPAGPDAALIDGLLANSAAGYSLADKTAVYTSLVSQEGTGTGLSITFHRSGKYDNLKIYDPEEDGDAEQKARAILAKRPELAGRLAGKGYAVLAPIEWPVRERDAQGGYLETPEPARELALPGNAGTLRWRELTLSLVSAGGKVAVLRKFKAKKPHQPLPKTLYTAAGQPVVLIKLQWLPGSAYAQGYNIYETVEVVELPAAH